MSMSASQRRTGHARRLRTWLAALVLLLSAPWASAQDLPRKYALLIGVNQYASNDQLSEAGIPQLQFAVEDAAGLAKRLAQQGFVTTVLSDEMAHRNAVITHLLQFADTLREEDIFVLYYAGHGVRRAATGQVYWLNHDGDPLKPDLAGLRVSHLMQLVREIPAKRKLVLLDHCYAAEIMIEDPGSLPPVAGGGRAPGARSVGRSSNVQVVASARDAMPVVEAQAEGVAKQLVIMAASRGSAFEVSTKGHGVFTYALLQAMSTDEADTAMGGRPSDGALTISELINYLRIEVPKLSQEGNFDQKPFAKPYGDDIPELMAWAPFLRDLMPAEIVTRARSYADVLRKWNSKHLIEATERAECETVLSRWQEAPASLSTKDLQIIRTLRELIDNPPLVSDETLTGELSTRLAALRGLP